MAACIHMGPDMQAGGESLVAAPVWAYPWVHRATRVALDLIEGRSVARESSRGPRSNLRGASTCVKSEIQVHIKNLGLIFRSALGVRYDSSSLVLFRGPAPCYRLHRPPPGRLT